MLHSNVGLNYPWILLYATLYWVCLIVIPSLTLTLCFQGHMKHHGVVTKTTRPPARTSRSSTDQLSPSTSLTSLNIPATRSSAGFWNQYQAFLNTSNEPIDDPIAGSQGESESAQSAKSDRSQMDPRTPNEAGEESSEGS